MLFTVYIVTNRFGVDSDSVLLLTGDAFGYSKNTRMSDETTSGGLGNVSLLSRRLVATL